MKTVILAVLCLMELNSLFGQSGWVNLGPNGGLVDAVVADYTAPGVLIAGTQTGDFYRSVNDGQSWNFLSALPTASSQAIERLVVDTSNGQRLYAASGNQIYSSNDGGLTWTAAANSDVENVFDLAISPINSSQLYAAAEYKIWRSLNYGLSWSAVFETEDTVQITAFAFAPNNPQNKFFMGLQTETGHARIVGTDNGGANLSTLLQLPAGWIVAKIFVADDANSTLLALIGDDDSTKIIRSINGGQIWNTSYAAPSPLTTGIVKLTFFNWIAWNGDHANQILGTSSGILQTTNNGASWFKLSYLYDVFTTTLVRSPLEHDVLYGRAVGEGAGLSRIMINPGGSLAFSDINYGLTATTIEKVLFADGNDLMLTSNTNEILISQNGGFDFTRFGLGLDNHVMAAWESQLDEAYYWITESGYVYRSETGISSQLMDSIPYPPGTQKVLSAAVLNYYDEMHDADSTLIIVSVGADALTNGIVMVSADDGVNWKPINYTGPFGSSVPKQVSVDYSPVIPLYAANDQSVFRQAYKGAPIWSPSFTAPAGHTIAKFASRYGYFLFILSETSAGIQRIDASFFDPQTGNWESFDLTYTLAQIDPMGQGKIEDIYAGEDASYLLYNFHNGTRKLFKASFYADVVWHNVTASPLDQLTIRSMIDDNDYEDQSFSLYAAADNGIWVLKQTAILSHDTLVVSPPTSINLQDTSVFPVSYRNDGAAVAIVDSFRITGDSYGEFGFSDPYFYQEHSPYPLDLTSTTNIQVYYAPTRMGISQAYLTAYYRGRSSRGIDSVFSLSTRLAGTPRASRISTGLRGDSLDMRGAMVYGSKTAIMNLGNSGSDTMYVYDLRVSNGTYFAVEIPEDISTGGYLAIPPNQSEIIRITFAPQSAGLVSDSLVIVSSAHHFASNTPDAEHPITLTGTGSILEVTNLAQLRPQLGQSQGVTVNLSIAQLTASDVSSTLYYRQIGRRSEPFVQVPFIPATGQSGFTAVIPQDEISQNGLEFYIEATGSVAQGSVSLFFPDPSRSDSTYALSVHVPRPGLGSSGYLTLPGGTGRTAFQLASFPISLTNSTPQGAFAESNLGQIGDQGDWQLYRYLDADERWLKATDTDISFGNIESGKSYLIITRQPRTLNSGAGRTMTPDRASVEITPGWNMIANPYAFGISWLDVALYNDGVEYGNIVTLQNGRFRYVEDSELASLQLEPWRGYMYYSPPDSGSYTLYYPAVSTVALAKSRPAQDRELTEGEYLLDISLLYDETESLFKVGELTEALSSTDRFDKPTLPVLDDRDIQLVIGNNLQSDFRPVSPDGTFWDMTIHTGKGSKEATLHVGGMESLPAGFQVVLIDLDRNKTVHLEEHGFRATSQMAQYRLVVGTAEFIEKTRSNVIPTSFYLDGNYPNPFNPSTTIGFGLPQTSRVELAVYNMLGQKVRTLDSGTRSAGVHTSVWDGLSDSGRLCASGVYIYRIQAVSLDGSRRFSRTNKMTLLK